MSEHSAGRVLVGMEVHLQLKTNTKCFSPTPYRYGAEPNTLIDPVVMGLPGALPVLNREAVRLAIRTGLALGCEVAEVTKWDRKNYFYPDLPKGYQISQYDQPLCIDGAIEIDDDDGNPKRVRIRRAHLEEDTGKSTHDEGGAASRVDLNRAGAPLLEIVSEPDIASAGEAMRYLDALREIVAYLGTSDGNMQEGNLRCEPNINVLFDGGGKTPIVEVKNLNSVRNVGLAIEYETERQTRAYHERGQTMENTPRSTRGWDDDKGVTVHQRFKESEDDYRYFPEPDLPPVTITRDFVEAEREALPELPRARRARYREALGLSEYDAGVLTAEPALSAWYEQALAGPEGTRDAKAVANWIQGELLRYLNDQKIDLAAVALTPEGLGELVDLRAAGSINSRTAKDLFREVIESGASPAALVAERRLGQVSDRGAVEAAVRAAMEAQAKAVEAFRAGNEKARGRIFGEAMKQLSGRGDPQLVNEVLSELLG
ncbi:MAG: Asp-tRNA(Asn)/Glu-tRNA(Gln) amidotransferase subunit GatB [Planctomycetota bacterium]|nr:Asp-tRNA(Asn)/Glu-tRNA(Gln) amidotransferase subunit GatB [Planctomycetota bacterium]